MTSNSASSTASGAVSEFAEIAGLREQIIANAVVLYPARNTTTQVIVHSSVWPEDGFFSAKLIDWEDKAILLGQGYSPSVPQALRRLLKETCDEIRDSCKLDQYEAIDRYTE